MLVKMGRAGSIKSVAKIPRESRQCPLIVELSDVPARLDLARLFDNHLPVELEIGTGKGSFLLNRSASRPEVNFIGLEWAQSYCLYSADRFQRAGISNVRMLRAEAGWVFRNALAPGSIQRIHIYFPDPWPKRRHHHRRLIEPGFVQSAIKALAPGGQLLIVTDHMEYFVQIKRVLISQPGLARCIRQDSASLQKEQVGTNFERKYMAQGRPIYMLTMLRYA